MTTDKGKARELVERLTGFTPGPWTGEVDLPYNVMPRVHGADGSLICVVGNTACDQDEWEANARLIFSAPDMHRLLTALLAENDLLREALDAARNACDERADMLDAMGPELECCISTAKSCAGDIDAIIADLKGGDDG